MAAQHSAVAMTQRNAKVNCTRIRASCPFKLSLTIHVTQRRERRVTKKTNGILVVRFAAFQAFSAYREAKVRAAAQINVADVRPRVGRATLSALRVLLVVSWPLPVWSSFGIFDLPPNHFLLRRFNCVSSGRHWRQYHVDHGIVERINNERAPYCHDGNGDSVCIELPG